MTKTNLIDLIKLSMQDSAKRVRCSIGRKSFATTRSHAIQQVRMLEQARQQVNK